jgi:hypothetical protein
MEKTKPDVRSHVLLPTPEQTERLLEICRRTNIGRNTVIDIWTALVKQRDARARKRRDLMKLAFALVDGDDADVAYGVSSAASVAAEGSIAKVPDGAARILLGRRGDVRMDETSVTTDALGALRFEYPMAMFKPWMEWPRIVSAHRRFHRGDVGVWYARFEFTREPYVPVDQDAASDVLARAEAKLAGDRS